jgi:ABC-type dipeptide/oligopeptide/nickel transport system permease subunit
MKNPEKKSESEFVLHQFETDFQAYLIGRLKAPITLIGLIIVIFFTLVALIVPITIPLREALAPLFLSDIPPYLKRPFGIGILGRDIFLMVLWGIVDAWLFASFSVFIGFVSSILLIKYLKIPTRFNLSEIHSLILRLAFYIIPAFITFEFFNRIPFFLFGLLLLPSFSLMIGNMNSDIIEFKQLLKRGLIYSLFMFAYTIFVYEINEFTFPQSGSFLGLDRGVRLTKIMIVSTDNPISVYWPVLFPLLTIILIILGFLLFYHGLKVPNLFEGSTIKQD